MMKCMCREGSYEMRTKFWSVQGPTAPAFEGSASRWGQERFPLIRPKGGERVKRRRLVVVHPDRETLCEWGVEHLKNLAKATVVEKGRGRKKKQKKGVWLEVTPGAYR